MDRATMIATLVESGWDEAILEGASDELLAEILAWLAPVDEAPVDEMAAAAFSERVATDREIRILRNHVSQFTEQFARLGQTPEKIQAAYAIARGKDKRLSARQFLGLAK